MARRGFLRVAAAVAATIATTVLAGCIPGGEGNTGPGQNGAEQQGTSGVKLESLVSIIDGLNGLKVRLSSYSAQVLAIGGTAEQNQNISDYVGKLGEARAAVAALEENAEGMGSLDTQIDRLLSDGSADNDPPYTNADDFLRALTELTDLGKANRGLALGQYNLKTIIVEKDDNGSEALLLAADKAKADPDYKGDHIDTPDYSGGKKNLGWDMQRAIERGEAYNGLVSFADPNHADPDSAGTPKYSIDVPEGADADGFMSKIKVEKYEPIEEGEPLDAKGLVISLGEQEVGDTGTPDVKIYAFDKKVEPKQFTAATATSYDFFTNRTLVYKSKGFDEAFLEAKAYPGQYHGVTYGNQKANSQVIPKGANIGDVLIERGTVTLDEKIDTANFNTDNSYNKVGGAWANGDVYEFNELENGRMAVTVFSYVNSENYHSVRFPNPNDNDINGLYDEFASYYSVSPIAI